MIKQYDIYGLNEEQTKSVIMKELKNKNNINIVSIIPSIEGNVTGFNVTVSYEEEKINVNNVRELRERISDLRKELVIKNNEINELNDKKYRIETNCSHEIVIKTAEKRSIYGTAWEEFYCLICNHCFLSTDAVPTRFNKKTKFIYYVDGNLKNEEKVKNALNMFYYEKEQNPDLDDEEIVKKINQKIKVKGK